MSEKRDLAIVALLLGLLGGALVLVGGLGLDLGRLATLTLDVILARIVYIVLGLGLLLGSVMIYRGSYSSGGILNLILGIVALAVGAGTLGAVLGLISGVLGLLANETHR
jgi:hypothetical protein